MEFLAFDSSLSRRRVTVRTHRGDRVASKSLVELLDFLTVDDDRERVVWDVGTFVAPIASLLEQGDLTAFIERRRLKVGRYTLLHTPDRVFQVIRDDKVFYAYSCVRQYYEDEDEPEELRVVAEKMAEVVGAVQGIGIEPRRISSHANLLQPMFDRLDLPNYLDLPRGAGRYSFTCCKRLWREAHKIGWFEHTWDYDISSAFASRAMELYDTRQGTWVPSDERPPDAVYGFIEGDVMVDSDLAPITTRDRTGACVNTTGKWWDIVPVQLVDMLDRWDIGEVEMYDGWWWIPERGRVKHKPMYRIVNELYELRGRSDVLDRVVKKALSAMFYGRFMQRKANGGPGDWFFPPYAAIIEAEIAVQVAEFVLRNKAEYDVISIAVDGVLADKELKVTGERNGSNGIGKWRFEGEGPALVLGTGVYFHGDKRPSGIRYDEAMEMVRKHPEVAEWGKMVKCKVGLGDALDTKGSMGKVVEKPQGFGIKHHHDRRFVSMPLNGKDLMSRAYESRAYSMTEIKRQRNRNGKSQP